MRRWPVAVIVGCFAGSIVCWVSAWLIQREIAALADLHFDDPKETA